MSLMELIREYDQDQLLHIKELKAEIRRLQGENAKMTDLMMSGIAAREKQTFDLIVSGMLRSPKDAGITLSEDFTAKLIESIQGLMNHWHPNPNAADTCCEFCGTTAQGNHGPINHRADCTGLELLSVLQAKYSALQTALEQKEVSQ